MLSITQSRSPEQAAAYFTQGLARDDYYREGERVPGRWGGRAATRLGLFGEVNRDAFLALTLNLDPATGEPLTARTRSDRTVGYDFTFQAPKSLSVLHALNGDDRLLEAFDAARDETLAEIEAAAAARVRTNGADEDRTTGNLIWASFTHTTSRPVDGEPDPHLHTHVFIVNATHDPVEGRWKAAQFRHLKRDAPYFEAAFHARLAMRVRDLGYPVVRTPDRWEIDGVDEDLRRTFSRRTAQIEAYAREHGILESTAKARLGALTRAVKVHDLDPQQLQRRWFERLSPLEAERLFRLTQDALTAPPATVDLTAQFQAARAALDRAIAQGFERTSTLSLPRLAGLALAQCYGKAGVDEVWGACERPDLLQHRVDDQVLTTTREVLARELAMLSFARDTRGTCAPLAKAFDERLQAAPLSGEQRAAAAELLGSRDRVVSLSGGAGVGKTTLMQTVVRAIHSGGKQVRAFAPSAEASRGVLRSAGFENAETVARLLHDEHLQAELKGGVIWVDEAGLLSVGQTNALFEVAARQNARVLLTGDTRQHTSVERGDALRLLHQRGGIVSAEVRRIRRQHGRYKEAVEAFAQLKPERGLNLLEEMGSVREVWDHDARAKDVAADYARLTREGKEVLVVCPTLAEGERVTGIVRDELRRSGRLAAEERRCTRLIDQRWTLAERSDPTRYHRGLVIELHQNVKGFTRGSRLTVEESSRDGVRVVSERGASGYLKLDKAAAWQVYERRQMGVSVGERIRITRGGFTTSPRKRLENGRSYTVKGFTPEGDLRLNNGWVLSKSFGHVAHGYVSTSHAAQGKTVDHVLLAQSSESYGAGSRQQIYVSVSRGREGVTLFTDDRQELLAAIRRDEQRLGASELVDYPRPVDQRRHHARELARLARHHELNRDRESGRAVGRGIGNGIGRHTPRRPRDLERGDGDG